MNGERQHGPWRIHDFRLAWLATFLNNSGDWVLRVALPVFVFIETGSGVATAALFVSQLVMGAVLGPLGGALVDRLNLKRVILATNVAQAFTLLPLLAVSAARIWPAFVVMALQSALTQVNDPANMALIPRVVPTEQLTQANATLGAANSLARLIGAPVGGVLLAWFGLSAVVLVDVASFLLVALAIGFLRSDTDPVSSPTESKPGVRQGMREARETPPLPALIGVMAFSQIAQGAFSVLFVVFVVETLNDDGALLGIIRGAMAIGALLGAALITKLHDRVDPPRLLALGLLGLGSTALLFWNAPAVTLAPIAYVVLFAASGIPGSAIGVGLSTTVQIASPPQTLGRITGLLSAGVTIGVAAGSIVAGLLVDHVRLSYLLNAQVAIDLIAGVAALLYVRLPSQLTSCVSVPDTNT